MAFKYRLRPTKGQERKMLATLNECRWLYNHFLEERKNTYEQMGNGLTMFDQILELPALKAEQVSLQTVYSQVLQNVAVRIDLAYKAFFRRVKSGEKPGYPRFRGSNRYDSFCYPQPPNGCRLDGNRLRLSKIGDVRVILHRPILGKSKTATIHRTSTGKWYVIFTCEVEVDPLSENANAIGIDVGLSSFATLSTGEKVDNPRFFRHDEKALAKAQRRMSKEAKGTPEREKRRQVVTHIHERVASRRHDFAHQLSRSIVNRYGLIAVEDIHVNRMLHNHCLAKSIADAAWSDFLRCLSYKAEYAGRKWIAVNPAYTSQDCSACGHRQQLSLSDREYHCPCCDLVMDRDQNAALNILALGLQRLGIQPVEAAQVAE